MTTTPNTVGSFEIDETIEFTKQPAKHAEEEKDLVQVVRELLPKLELFHNTDGEAFAACVLDGKRVSYPVESTRFKQLIRAVYYQAMQTALAARTLSDLIEQLAAEAQFNGVRRDVHRRVAGLDDTVLIDLADGTARAIRITAIGWDIVTNPDVVFVSDPRCGPLPMPERGGTIEDLRPFVNVASGDDFWLLTGFLVACFRPRGPYPVLLIDGPQGSAKSSMTKLVKKLIDPTRPLVSRMSGKTEDLLIAARHTWLLAYDNLSGLGAQASDTICTIATGGGFTTRKFFTNSEEVYFEVTAPVVLNGIDGIAERGDLADRGIHLELAAIAPEARRDEDSFWADFEKARPKILGALCDAVSMALRRVSSVRLPRMPRMADLARWITAAEVSFGTLEGTFVSAYEANREEALVAVAEADPVALDIAQYFKLRPGKVIEITATKLLEELNLRRGDRGFDRMWPRTAQSLSNRLRRAQPALLTLGIRVQMFRQGKGGARIIRLEPFGTTPAPPPVSTVSLVGLSRPSNDDADGADGADGADEADEADDASTGAPNAAPQRRWVADDADTTDGAAQ